MEKTTVELLDEVNQKIERLEKGGKMNKDINKDMVSFLIKEQRKNLLNYLNND